MITKISNRRKLFCIRKNLWSTKPKYDIDYNMPSVVIFHIIMFQWTEGQLYDC